jgi:hypothetical protein
LNVDLLENLFEFVFLNFIRNILSMKNAELVSFVESLLDMTLPGNKQFFNELMERLSAPAVNKDITVIVGFNRS